MARIVNENDLCITYEEVDYGYPEVKGTVRREWVVYKIDPETGEPVQPQSAI